MSRYSGKCDLYDHLMMENGKNEDSIESEFECFELFKKRTGGVLHQHLKIELTEFNIKREISRRKGILKRTLHEKEVKDKRCKEGKKINRYYTYTYHGQEYPNLEELNKRGYWTILDLHFDTILDLVPYFPYIIASAACDAGTETIFISEKPYPTETDIRLIKSGLEPFGNYYRQALQEHYIDVVKYLLKEGGKENA